MSVAVVHVVRVMTSCPAGLTQVTGVLSSSCPALIGSAVAASGTVATVLRVTGHHVRLGPSLRLIWQMIGEPTGSLSLDRRGHPEVSEEVSGEPDTHARRVIFK